MSESKTKNKISRESILKLRGLTEENICEGLTIQEVLPFFEKFKLKLRVFDVFYNFIFKYDPKVPNFHNRPLYCVADGDHIYTLNKDPDSLAQKAESDDFKVFANSNFRIPDKPKEKPNCRVTAPIRDLLVTLREEPVGKENPHSQGGRPGSHRLAALPRKLQTRREVCQESSAGSA